MLLASDKKGIFTFDSIPSIGYPSGLFPLDYSNGYWVRVNNSGKKNVPDRWLNIGTQGGTFYTIIGNSGVGKSALAILMGSTMVRPFDMGDYYHNDAEGTSNPTRVQTLNHYTNEEMENKYHFPNIPYVEDEFTMIYNIAQLKINNKEFAYDTGCYDSRGNKIIIPQPTAMLIDSLPSLQTKDVEESNDLGTQTYNMRLAIAYNTFYKRLRPIIRDANITVFAINHIKEKPQMGFVQTQAKIQYLKPNENIPGGSGPIYYSQNLLRVIYRGKFVKEKHGFDGFMVEAFNIKSKTNKSGTSVHLIYHADRGFDPLLTMLKFAEDNDLIKGRNPYSYLETNPDFKFNTKDIDGLLNNEHMMGMLMDACAPYLNDMVGNLMSFNNTDMSPTELIQRLNDSYKESDADKSQIIDDIIDGKVSKKKAAYRFSMKNNDSFKLKHAFDGMHRYGIRKDDQPYIERYMNNDVYGEAFKRAVINEMHGGWIYG
jgi:hypothetical protein